jgi:adenosylcobinamide-GDP ribazoletransferase
MLSDLLHGFALLTRLPVGRFTKSAPNLGRTVWVFPLVGLLVGAVWGLVYWGGYRLGMPPVLAALTAFAVATILTGAFHEDGFADVADGFGGGRTADRKLEIMRDSRIGSYGAIALLVSFATKLSALAAIPNAYVIPSLIAAHALARGVLPALALNLPYARPDGLARSSGQPDPTTTAIAGGLALLIALLSLSWGEALWAAVVAAISGFVIARLALRQIGGQTGDVLGAAEQLGETAILVLLAAKFG